MVAVSAGATARGRGHGARLFPVFQLDFGWAAGARCRDADREMFFAGGRGAHEYMAQALALCAECPVRRECLDHAVTVPERFGIWGGTTARERGWDSLGKPITAGVQVSSVVA